MHSLRRLVMVGGVALVACCLAAMSPDTARAQDASSQSADWQASGPPPEVSQPETAPPPLDLAGCWSGSVQDNTQGSGTGFLFFVQDGKKLVNGTDGGFESGSREVSGPLKGTANSRTFHLGYHKKQCNVSYHGTINSSSGALTGTYHLTKKCVGVVLDGTFDFTFDPTDTSC